MCTNLKRLTLIFILIPVIISSCIRSQFEDCGMYLEFIFDYNMEYADAFIPQVNTVDVYIFDENGIFIFHQYANTTDLIHNKRMYLNLQSGVYQLVTIGGMSENFRFTDQEGNELKSGKTTIEQVKLYMDRKSTNISHEFPHLWFAEATTFTYNSDNSIFPVYLVRNTNKFNIMLQNVDIDDTQQHPVNESYTFEIIAPEGAVYGHNNNPLTKETITYHPFHLQLSGESESFTVGKLNTMRLFTGFPEEYRLVVRNTATAEDLWNYDLIDLLKKTKPNTRPDGTSLPVQEYLDRQGEWNIIILYRGGRPDSGDGFLALSIEINGWIISLNNIEI